MEETEEKNIQKYYRYIPTGIMILGEIFFVMTILVLGILPTAYVVAIGAILAFIAALLILWTAKAVKEKSIPVEEEQSEESGEQKKLNARLIPQIISILLSAVVVIGGVYIINGSNFINKITGAGSQTVNMSVVVFADSKYKELPDLKDKRYGVYSTEGEGKEEDTKLNKIATNEIKSLQGALYMTYYPDLNALADALYNKEIDAMVVNEAYLSLMEPKHENINKETKSIWTYRITQEIEDQADKVDVTTESFNVYMSGIDTLGPVSSVSRTDVNMILTVNPLTREILMTSLPRDYFVPLAGYGADDKLTHSGIYGVNESIDTIEGFMGVDINYYAKVNFTSVKNIVNSLGWIRVYSDRELQLEDFHIKQGMNKMNGSVALRYARERYSYIEGDNHRIQNQQEVMKGLVNKITSPSVIKNYPKLLKVAGGCMETSMEAKDLKKLAKMQMSKGGKWHLTGYLLKGTEDISDKCYSAWGTELCIIVPDWNSVAEAGTYIDKVMKGEKLDIE